MRKLFFLFLALVATTSLWAQTFQVGDLYYNITSDVEPYTVEVTSHSSSYPYNEGVAITTATIPETVTYNGTTYSVTSIGESAFRYCLSLTSITIPNSVTSIGDWAFSNCISLTTITIPNSVTSIGNHAFYWCPSLTSITIPNSVTSIGDDAFDSCFSLTKTNYTGDIAGWCNIKFGDGDANPIYYSHNFYINDQEIKDLVIPNSITSIGEYTFYGCSSLTSVTIPNSVTSIGEWAFSGCSSLVSMVVESGNTKYDSRDNCNAIIETATNILIAGCQNTIIPNSVTSIGNGAFYYCRSLTSIVIPNSVTSIGDRAFVGCSSLTTPVYNAHCFAYIPISFKGAYVIPEGIKQIAGGAFAGCSYLTSVTIPNSVTSIGDAAFYACFSLTSITIPNSVINIGKEAFYYCSSLTSITIPNSVTYIGEWAFFFCSSLTSITIPNSVTSIGDYAFYYCESLDTVICLAMTPPALGEDVFDGCDNPTLFVPCAALSDYQAHEQWGKFTTIECISSEEADTEDVIIESGTTTIQKIMRDGQLIILRDGVEYNAMGAQIQ